MLGMLVIANALMTADAERVEDFVETGAPHLLLPSRAPFDLAPVERLLTIAKGG